MQDAALLVCVVHAAQRLQEALLRVHLDQIHAHLLAVAFADELRVTLAQKPGVDEQADQPLADGAMQQRGGHGAVHAHGHGDQHLRIADGRARVVDERGGEVLHRPAARTAADGACEVLQDCKAVGVVGFHVELQAVDVLFLAGEAGNQPGGGDGDGPIALGQLVAVHAVEEAVVFAQLGEEVALLKLHEVLVGRQGDALMRRADGLGQHARCAAEGQHRHAQRLGIEGQGRGRKRVAVASGQDHALRSAREDDLRGGVARNHLAVVLLAAQPACGIIGGISAKIQYEDQIRIHQQTSSGYRFGS